MEKIVKLEEFNWVSGRDAITIALCNTIIRKQNEIIDHLNSQDQAEEKPVYVMCLGEEIVAGTDKSIKKHKKDTEDFLKTQSTPEQKEGWEFDLRNLMYRDGEQLRSAGEGKPYTGEYRELVVSMIKNLLSEREREVLDKLNKKK